MAQLSADTLAFVNFACGSNAECTCCCGAEEEEEEEESGPGSPCREDDRGAGGSGGVGPAHTLHLPASREGAGSSGLLHSCKERSLGSSDDTASAALAAAAAAGDMHCSSTPAGE